MLCGRCESALIGFDLLVFAVTNHPPPPPPHARYQNNFAPDPIVTLARGGSCGGRRLVGRDPLACQRRNGILLQSIFGGEDVQLKQPLLIRAVPLNYMLPAKPRV